MSTPSRCDERHFDHVPAETAVAVVILPVDIRRDCAANGDVAGARRHRDEPALRNQAAHQLVKADAAPYSIVPVPSSSGPTWRSPAVSIVSPPVHWAASP